MKDGIEKIDPQSDENSKQEENILRQKVEPKNLETFKFQERPQFLDESVTEKDEDHIRRTPTFEEQEKMDESINKLGNLFEGSNVRWQLDGALNISIMKGDYIGVHKDVDLSIESDDLEKLNDQLGIRGYGLFLSTDHPTDPTKRQMEHVGAQQFREAPEANLMIAAVNEDGKIKENETLNYVDVHLVKRDEQGNPLGPGGVKLPSKWYEPQLKKYQEVEINLSHPAKVAYFKIREQDLLTLLIFECWLK